LTADEDEAAVDDLLVAQHYAFEDESDASGEIPQKAATKSRPDRDFCP
jgi:hypothetical protein